MRVSELFGRTLREAPADAQLASHRLLVRGGFLRPVAAGVYAWLPPGLRVLEKVADVVRAEMDAAGASEILMPALVPRDLLERSGRWESFGVELYRFADASEREWGLGPTHEEVVTLLASMEISSYRDLPVVPYQIQWKYRYAPRPRGGLLRSREFLMKDAYSMDADEDGLRASYDRMVGAYGRIFDRLGITARTVEASAGVIGGSVNHEFVQPSSSGEDTFVACGSCGYAANTEVAGSMAPRSYDFGPSPGVEKVHTPGMVTVGDVARFLETEPARLVKALMYTSSGDVVCALVPGDREVNEDKLGRFVGGTVTMLTGEDFRTRGWAKGFSGPVGLDGVRVLADRSLEGASNVVTGANEADHHLVGVTPGRDFVPDAYVDLVVASDGDRCARCPDGLLSVERGIEVGHVFQLGTKYSQAFGATFTDPSGEVRPLQMGCYGLGISRAVAAIVEEHHDERGMTWPRAVAPFDAVVLVLAKDAADFAAGLVDQLGPGRVVLDDRDWVSAGEKFADADLIGYPLQVVVGKTYTKDGRLEVTVRATGERSQIDPTAQAVVSALEECP